MNNGNEVTITLHQDDAAAIVNDLQRTMDWLRGLETAGKLADRDFRIPNAVHGFHSIMLKLDRGVLESKAMASRAASRDAMVTVPKSKPAPKKKRK